MRLVRSLYVCLLLAALSVSAAEPVALAVDVQPDPAGVSGLPDDAVLLAVDLQSASDRVDVSFVESVRYHTRGNDIRKLCRAGFDVIGCTDFPKERIDCKCEKRGDHWVLDARAVVEAQIHLADRRSYNKVLGHERMHLVDLESALRAHLGGIVAQRFESAPGCEELARVMSSQSYVRAVMNRLRRASNEKYHCQRPGSPVESVDEQPIVALAR